MSDARHCWGRGDEIEKLILRVLRQRKSATLLYGDSAIGKTTVFKEVKERLSACPNMLVGLYEASPADSEPILHVLDDLLRRIYIWSGRPDPNCM
jgi:predicted ATPase